MNNFFTSKKTKFAKLFLQLFCLIIPGCITIPLAAVNDSAKWSLKDYLEKNNFIIDFDVLLEATFEFKLRTIKLRINLPYNKPECYALTGKVIFKHIIKIYNFKL